MVPALASMIVLAFALSPAFATTTINLPPYSSWNFFNGAGNCNDHYNASPSFGNIWLYAQTGCGTPGSIDVRLVYSSVFLNAGQTITLSGIQANIKGFLYAAPVTGASSTVQVNAYISQVSDCSQTVGSSGSTQGQLLYYTNNVQGTTWSTNQLYTAPNFVYTPTSSGTYYICAYGEGDASGGASNAHFSNFDGSTNGITNFKVTATY